MQSLLAASSFLSSKKYIYHIRLQMIFALLPGIFAMYWFFGAGVLINISLAIFTAVTVESILLKLQRRKILAHLSDLSAISTALLLALCLPSLAPWWLSVVGAAFAIIVIKHFFGNLNSSPFNPAMAGYVMLLISFPQRMTTWITPSNLVNVDLTLHDILYMAWHSQTPDTVNYDAITSPTPLDALNTLLNLNQPITTASTNPLFGHLGGAGWEIISLAYLCGGLWLVYRDIISWAIPAGILGGLSLFAIPAYYLDNTLFATPMLHLFTGATMLGAFFIATDLQTTQISIRNQLLYGLIIGIVTYLIRIAGGYPDGMAFAVLIANLTLALID